MWQWRSILDTALGEANDISGGWGAPLSSASKPSGGAQPTVAADEDFGGWTSAATPAASTGAGAGTGTGNQASNAGQKQGGGFGGGSDDLFSNVWE